MKIQFYPSHRPLKGHLADVQLIFEESGLRGLSLAGIALWRSHDGQNGIQVTLPQRTYPAKEGRPAGAFSYLRGDSPAVEKLKTVIVAEFLRRQPELARGLSASSNAAGARAEGRSA